MIMWQLLVILGLVFLVLEMFTPMLFFLNFAIASFITAIASFIITDINILMLIFVVLSLLLLWFLRPLLVKSKNQKNSNTGMKSKYIGQTAKVIEEVTSDSGVISIYDERWNARSINNEIIPIGSIVEIVKHESLIMSVKLKK